MSDKPKVSIIIPVYNIEKYINECIESLVNQTYDNLEIIFVDDGSKDNSGIICDKTKEKYANRDIKVVHKTNGGLVSAWKAGVEVSTGDYLSFLDGDDYIDTNMIFEMVEKTSDCKKEIISSDYVIERDSGKNSNCYQRLESGEYLSDRLKKEVKPNLLGYEHRLIHVSRCMKLISRQLFLDNIKYSDESLLVGEDLAIMISCFMDMERLYVMDHKTYYHYRLVESSMAHKYDKYLVNNIEHLFEVILNTINSKFSGEEVKLQTECMNREYIIHLLLIVKNEARGNAKGYIKNIKKLANDEKNRELIKEYPIVVNEKSNKLLYFVLKHPNLISCLMLRAAMKIYYR